MSQVSGTNYVINSVFFIDENTGTAVGGEFLGLTECVILRTTNAGEIWTTQTSGTNKRLEGVCYIDTNNETAVGLLWDYFKNN